MGMVYPMKFPGKLSGFAFLFCALVAQTSQADIGDGPRAYLPPPIDTDVFSLYGMNVSGNSMIGSGRVTPHLNLDVDLVVAQYTRTMEIRDRYISFTAVQPAGRLTSSLSLPNVAIAGAEASSEGLGDTQLLLTAGLYNLPPLTKETYRDYKPSFAVGGLARVTLPTGEYDQQQSANLGANRYSLQLGAPITLGFGESFLDPRLTTIDFLPSITLFGNNDDPSTGDTLRQEPLFKLETHVTHNLSSGFWLSLDSVYTFGGETETDGTAQNDAQRSFGLGGSLGLQFSKSLGLKASYGKIVDHNENGLDGEFIRLTLTYARL